MIKNIEKLTYVELIKKPYFYNHLIKTTSKRFLRTFLSKIKPDESILDVGSGKESVLPGDYPKIKIDINFDNKPDLVGSAVDIPLKALSVDHICCSWLFEHIEEPVKTLLEFDRILRTGGYLYLTTNFVWHLHEEPRDFYRYTKHGLDYLFTNYGKWKIIFHKPTAGFWITISQIVNYKLVNILKSIHPIVTLPVQVIGLLLERLNYDSSIAAGYCIIGKKVG